MRFPPIEYRTKRYVPRQFVSDYETEATRGLEMTDEVTRVQGTVKFFNAEKGFGFCSREGGADVFVHSNELKRCGIPELVKEGDKLEFDVIPVAGKNPKAAAIKRV